MSSSPEPASRDARSAAPRTSATATLWGHRAHGSAALPFAAALIGSDVVTLRDAVSLSIAASDEARLLLDGMELRIRTLPSTVDTEPERCINSVRGPILWSETL